MSETLTITTADGNFHAYLARPMRAQAPAIVVLQEIFGVNADLRKTCDELASQGFLAISPDLFWRMRPGVDLTEGSEAEWKTGLALYSAYNFDEGVTDIAATIAAARGLDGATGSAGVMGFCLGGLMTFLTAARTEVDAAVSYYGGGTDKYVAEAGKITTPLLMHLAEDDEFISKDAQRTIRAALDGHAQVSIHTYPGCSHAFARHAGQHFNAAAAAEANDRTLAFFQSHLN